MFLHLLTLLSFIDIIDGRHFDGGTINWAPVNPYSNASSVDVTITQSYAWAYPTISCANNVPISTSGRSGENWNLTCVVDCTTDGGYSTKPINVLTDCKSVSTSLGMMNSVRSHNLSLTAGSHFYLANVGSAWVSLNYPAKSGLEWSIVTFIDLRKRPDGFINTPPVASVVSPQYAIVNRTIQINIPVSDVNAGDDVRCRWSTYTPGYRRRKRSNEEDHKAPTKDVETIHIRKKRACTGPCWGSCPCTDSGCIGTNCGSGACGQIVCAATTAASTSTAATTTTPSTTTVSTTTIETQGTVKSTSSYPHRQAIDECGDICYPGSVPSGTTLSDCTITFTGLRAGVWYAVAIQVEDFINENSTTAMSSIPVQMLIYVMASPACGKSPVILPLDRCFEVQVGVTISFDLYALNLCNPSVAKLTDILLTTSINGMLKGNLTTSPTNSSLSYIRFTWTPQSNQIGSQQMCAVAYTDEQVQSTQYCVTFTVKASSDLCVTTTTSTTSTTSVTTTTTTTVSTTTSSATTTTTTTTSTSETTTTTSETTTTSTTSSTTSSSSSTSSTSSTSTTSTSTSSTSTSTSTTSTSTSTSSTSTSSTSTSTSTTTTSVTTTSSTSTTATTATTTTVTTTKAPAPSINWPLILGLSLLALLLALCCCCCCLYRFCWSPAARRRRRKDREVDAVEQTFGPRYIIDKARKTRAASRLFGINTASANYENYDVLKATSSTNSSFPSDAPSFDTLDMSMDIEESRPHSTVSVKRVKCVRIDQTKSSNDPDDSINTLNTSHSAIKSVSVNRISKRDIIYEVPTKTANIIHPESSSASALPRSNTSRVNVTKLPRNTSGKNTMNSEQPVIELQSTRSRSKTASHTTDTKTKTTNGVIVRKLPRAPNSAPSQHS